MPRAVLIAGLAAALLAGTGTSGTPPEVASGSTPLLSVRRVPGWLEEEAAAATMDRRLPGLLADAGRGVAGSSCLLVRQRGVTLFASGPTREVIPASNMKVLTATAVLADLGSSMRYTTRVVASARPVHGVLHGDLYLVGAGDPLLFTRQYDLEQDPPLPQYTSMNVLAARVRAAGIRRVDGSVIGDEALFDTQRGVPSWKPTYESEGDVGPLSALEVDNGFRTAPPYGPEAQPATGGARVLAGLLRADHVPVTGHAGAGRAPAGAVAVASVASAPLGEELGSILRVSDDTGAELLTKLLGLRVAGVGSTAAGVRVIHETLGRLGLPVGGLRGYDGSGLSYSDRVTCDLVVAALTRAGTSGPLFAGLPVAGETGTLAGRMIGTPAEGRLHAKTGTLDDVSALSGYVLPPAGAARRNPDLDAPIVFSMILDDLPDLYQGFVTGDEVGELLARPLTAPPPAAAAPVAGA